MGAHRLHAIVLAGGGGRRLGGASKADLDIAGRRLLERVLTGLDGVVDGLRVVVAPPSVRVPRGVLRTLEDPPHGGPLAGIGAGMDALGAVAGSASAADERVLVVSVDTPGVARLARLLVAGGPKGGARPRLGRNPASRSGVPCGVRPRSAERARTGAARRRSPHPGRRASAVPAVSPGRLPVRRPAFRARGCGRTPRPGGRAHVGRHAARRGPGARRPLP